jgi:hypothetical protein
MFSLVSSSLQKILRTEYRVRVFCLVCASVMSIALIGCAMLVTPVGLWSVRDAGFAGMPQMYVVAKVHKAYPDSAEQLVLASALLQKKSVVGRRDGVMAFAEPLPLLQVHTVSVSNTSALIVGVAATRESLVSFVSALRTSGEYARVEVPISDISGNGESFPFTITVTL